MSTAQGTGADVPSVPDGVDPVFFAQLKLRQRRFDECAHLCTEALAANPYDQVGAGRYTRQ